MNRANQSVRQNGEVYDIYDMQLALLDLNDHGFSFEVAVMDSKQIHLTCKKTHNRFVIDCLGHNGWPEK